MLQILRPVSVDEVAQIVRDARDAGRRLNAASTGRNWGYGKATPSTPGCQLVDLSGLDRIRNSEAVAFGHPIAVIEPGVTQGQLYDFLQKHCPELTFNVTGSARETSIIGNALERGVGYLGPRADDLFGLEVVTGGGEVIRTGFRRLGEDSPLAHSHPRGLGPQLDGLFLQGSGGTVVSACFRLRPRRPVELAVSFALRREADFAAFVDELARLKREGLMASVTHIGNRARTHSTLEAGIAKYLERRCAFSPDAARRQAREDVQRVAPHEWTSLAGVSGNAGQVRAMLREIRQRMRRWAAVRVVTTRRLDAAYAVADRLRAWAPARRVAAAIAAARPLHGLALGIPTDAAVDALLWRFGRPDLKATQLDESPCGILYTCPALPADGAFVDRIVRGMSTVAAAFDHELYVTVNIETDTSMVAVTNLLFDRTVPEEVERAHRCAKALLDYIHAQKLEVYRAREDQMADILARDPAYWRLVTRIKRSFDPDDRVWPGRYSFVDRDMESAVGAVAQESAA